MFRPRDILDKLNHFLRPYNQSTNNLQIRDWVDYYGFKFKHTPAGHRIYTEEHLLQLTVISFLILVEGHHRHGVQKKMEL